MLQLRSFVFLVAAVFGSVSAQTSGTTVTTDSLSASRQVGPSANLVIANKVVSPDGFTRLATLVNGIFPGPIIRAQKDATFSLNVEDRLTNGALDLGTSIHWHGLFQHHTNFVDGPAFVTQCPLIPNENFLYSFQAKGQTGTYWYHSHFKNQYCDGLRGALIIDDPNDPQQHLYDVDNAATVITLADWYHYLSTQAPAIPAFNATLINGKGRFLGGPQADFAFINVKQGVRYRFRLVSISCDPSFTFSIDNHTMTVIEVEGTNVQPLLVDSIRIFAGQRYSVVVKADQPINNYWLRALPITAGGGNTGFSGGINVGVFHYDDAPEAPPTTDPAVNVPVSVKPLVETDLHPLVPTPVPGNPTPGGADININLDVILNFTEFMFDINGTPFRPPTVPVLLQILSGAKTASQLVPAGSIYGLEPNKSVELTIPGGAVGGPHPVHLHGHNFHVVRSAGNPSYNFVNPVIRDVVTIGDAGDNVTIRFFTDNPGPWFFHCHIDWHLSAGFAVVFAEDVPDVPTQDITNDAWSALCPAFNKFINGTS
ncbi:laccase [Lactifluus volemus]|nr:laccase [Lactifluus volemus]